MVAKQHAVDKDWTDYLRSERAYVEIVGRAQDESFVSEYLSGEQAWLPNQVGLDIKVMRLADGQLSIAVASLGAHHRMIESAEGDTHYLTSQNAQMMETAHNCLEIALQSKFDHIRIVDGTREMRWKVWALCRANGVTVEGIDETEWTDYERRAYENCREHLLNTYSLAQFGQVPAQTPGLAPGESGEATGSKSSDEQESA